MINERARLIWRRTDVGPLVQTIRTPVKGPRMSGTMAFLMGPAACRRLSIGWRPGPRIAARGASNSGSYASSTSSGSSSGRLESRVLVQQRQLVLGQFQFVLAIPAAAIAEEAAATVAEAAINGEILRANRRYFDLPQAALFRFIPECAPASVWNCYKIQHFLLHLAAQLNIDKAASPKGSTGFMIVCSCNVLSDHDVRNAVSAASDLPRNAEADLWLPRLQRRVRPMRAHHQDHHR